MIETTVEEMIEFIKKQPDDREIRMDQNVDDGSCTGCLMIHFAREKGLKSTECAFKEWFVIDRSTFKSTKVMTITNGAIDTFVQQDKSSDGWFPKFPVDLTYGEVKEFLKKQGKL